ncbi:MAG: GTP-binding protein, partial [Synechococcaceae cyanobacterium SM2_3_1]|nr:GTP-binding protein [Synechococcaceae cyanobacterium SM2_3_1]
MTRQFQYQDDLNFQQAKRSLRQLLAGLQLTAAEQLGLETDLKDLQAFLEKLEEDRIHIAAFGMVGRGKSSLLNALLGHTVFHTGPTHGVTRTWQQAAWVLEENVVVNTAFGSQLILIDTPGLDEIAGEARAEMAQRVARQADLLLFVVSGDLTRVEYEALAQLREEGKPMLLVFNKIDQYPDMDRRLVYEKLCQDRVKQLLTPAEVVMVAASPRVPQPVYLEDGTVMAQLVQAPAQIEPLREKILEVLQREGRSLIGLNTLLFANRLQQEVIATKL